MSKFKISSVKPIHNYVRVKLDEAVGVTSGGLVLPDSAKERVVSGRVLEAGDGCWKGDCFVKTVIHKGQRIVFNQFAITDGKTFGDQAIISEDDILGIILED